MFCLYACLCSIWVLSVCKCQKRSDPQKKDLEKVVGLQAGVGDWTQVLWAIALLCWAISLALCCLSVLYPHRDSDLYSDWSRNLRKESVFSVGHGLLGSNHFIHREGTQASVARYKMHHWTVAGFVNGEAVCLDRLRLPFKKSKSKK